MITTFPNWVCLCKSQSWVDRCYTLMGLRVTYADYWEYCTSTDLRLPYCATLTAGPNTNTSLETIRFQPDTVGFRLEDFTFPVTVLYIFA